MAEVVWAFGLQIHDWKRRRYRTEALFYGPLPCPSYKPGPTREVTGRHGMTHEEQEWVNHWASRTG